MVERASRIGYLSLAVLFSAGVLTQVFLVGLSLLGGQPSWATHIGLGHGVGLLLPLMLVLAYLGRMPRPVKPLTWTVFGVYVLLADFVVFLRNSAPLVASLHPVLVVVLFALAIQMPIQAWRLLREPGAETERVRAEPGA